MKRTTTILLASGLFAVLLAIGSFIGNKSQGKSILGITQSSPAIFKVASTTLYITPKFVGVTADFGAGVLFGTTSNRAYLSISATSTTGFFVVFNDLPCNSANASIYWTPTSTAPFELNSQKMNTTAIRVCSVGATSSITAMQATY